MSMDPHLPQNGIGERLRTAREAAGLSIADVGHKLKMPVRVVESLEAEDWTRLGAPVFVRGQLRSYARLLGLPVDQVVQMPELVPVAATELKPRSYTPKVQLFAEQAARRAVYIVLTLAILVPVWVATRSQPEQIAGEAAPLDVPATSAAPQESAGAATTPESQARAPMRASLTPPLSVPAAPAVPALSLEFAGDSWVEIVGADGRVLESGLLASGQQRTYAAGEVTRMKLGNASVVSVKHEGQVQDLTPYLRSNVARFTVSSDGSLAPQAE